MGLKLDAFSPSSKSRAIEFCRFAVKVFGMNRALRIKVFDQLSTMLSAGLPLSKALTKIKQRHPLMELDVMANALVQGERASEAFERAGFESFEQNLIAAGERGGRLPEVFRALSLYYQRELAVTRAIKVAIAYPVILLNLVALIGPLPQLILVGTFAYVSSALSYLILIWILLIGVYFFVRLTWSSEAMQFFWMRLPLAGGFLRASYQYRWILALRMELNAGVSFHAAAADAWRATGWANRDTRAQQVQDRLLAGERLSSAMIEWPELPPDWAEYLATAEESGKINETLGQLETMALEEWKHAQAKLSSWMPYILYLILLLCAGGIVFSFVYERFRPVLDALEQL